jgi:ABC-type multidrug transport system fused ATPase/permease subunit
MAIVGETGSGKSTIINLISGLYPISKGRILIDGVDITEIPRDDCAPTLQLSCRMSSFSHAPSGKISSWEKAGMNPDFSRSPPSPCRQIPPTPPSWADQNVMERGVTFSAGERQLLAFTRALYFDPSILILDEATSNIDTETEVLIQDAISQLIKGRTSIVIDTGSLLSKCRKYSGT